MKKFQFRLERLLDLGRRQEELARAELAAALNGVRVAEESLVAIKERLVETQTLLADTRRNEPDNGALILALHKHLDRGEVLRVMALDTLATREESFKEAQENLIDKRREVIALERSREQALQEWQEDSDRAEASAMEEITSFRYIQNRLEESSLEERRS